jgi:phosphoribosylanthranilate isomerase
MTRIKICGITNLEDALAAVEYGADALGFICVPESPRFVPEESLASLTGSVPPLVSRIGVYADLSGFRPMWVTYFDAIQAYSGGFTPERWPRGIRACRVQDQASLDAVEGSLQGAMALLLDAYHPDKLGGSGETFNWDLAVEARERFDLPIILAGGLTAENVGGAVRQVRPYAVDVSSGVESSPGRKDHDKLRAFVEAVRAADREIESREGLQHGDP